MSDDAARPEKLGAREVRLVPREKSVMPDGPIACKLGRLILGERGGVENTTGIDAPTQLQFTTSLELEHAVLHLLAANDGPVGSGTLMERLHDLGYTGSEPTVGRFLRSLDRRGLTTRVSNRGRDLSDDGRHHLQQLCEAESRSHYERELIETIRVASIDDIFDVLVARRALERETARLAAERATPEEISALEAAIRSQREALATTGVAVDADELFHRLVAHASHNRVLVAAIDLIRRDKQLTILIDTILRRTAHQWVVGHDQILDAIRHRDPDAAERAMHAHINTLIDEVHRYHNSVKEETDGIDSSRRLARKLTSAKHR